MLLTCGDLNPDRYDIKLEEQLEAKKAPLETGPGSSEHIEAGDEKVPGLEMR